MVSHLFYYQLALLALVWLFIMLHLTWPKRSAATTTAPATPIQSKRTRSHEPKPKVFQSCGSAIMYGCLSGTEPPM